MIFDPLPNDINGAKLCQLFTYRWMSLEGTTEDLSKPDWKTVRNYPIRPRSLWAKWNDAKTLVGVRFGRETQYALLDIDKGSKWLNIAGLEQIKEALATIGINRTIPIRSSWSGGLHLYCPLPQPVATFDLACAIKYALGSQKIELSAGQLESFPNVKQFAKGWLGQFSEYNGHRLPLQPGSGSSLLTDDLQPTDSSLQSFFNRFGFGAKGQDLELLESALIAGRDSHRKKPRNRNHPLEQWRLDWELDINEGWTDHGQTNALLKTIAAYGRVFLRLEGEDLHSYTVETAMNAPGFAQWSNHQYDLGRRALVWCSAVEQYYWPLGSLPSRDKNAFNFNDERAADAQSRIKSAVEWLQSADQWPADLTQRLKVLAKTAKASFTTLYKYRDLWQTVKRCVIDHSASDTADSSGKKPLQPDRLKSPPHGLLHTSSQITKGVEHETAFKSLSSEGAGGVARGAGGFPQGAGA